MNDNTFCLTRELPRDESTFLVGGSDIARVIVPNGSK